MEQSYVFGIPSLFINEKVRLDDEEVGDVASAEVDKADELAAIEDQFDKKIKQVKADVNSE